MAAGIAHKINNTMTFIYSNILHILYYYLLSLNQKKSFYPVLKAIVNS